MNFFHLFIFLLPVDLNDTVNQPLMVEGHGKVCEL